jgi:hypothetical protein
VHTFVVLVGRVHRGAAEALQYARSLRPHHLVALHIAGEDVDHAQIQEDWRRFGFEMPLDVVDSPYRELPAAVGRYLDRLDARWPSDTVTVVIPEFVVGVRNITNLLHGQNALALKLALLERPHTCVLSVPFHLNPSTNVEEKEDGAAGPTRLRRTSPSHHLDRARRANRVAAATPDGARICSLVPRTRVTVTGEVVASRVVPKASSPWLELTVDDGTGSLVATFTGRRSIPGIQPGTLLELEGMLRDDHGQQALLNPAIRVFADSHE